MTIGSIATLARFLSDSDSTSYTDANLLINLNNSYEKIIGNLIGLNHNILFGDSRFTSLPTGLVDLVAGTQSYRLTTIDANWLTVHTVKVKDVDGIWSELTRRDDKEVEPIEEYQKTNGMPAEYTVREGFIRLFPAPAASSVTTTSGLQIVFERTASVFTAAELVAGTAIPGFASPYHELMAYDAAIPYAIKYKPERINVLMAKAKEIENNLLDFYGSYLKDDTMPKTITTRPISFR